MSRYEFHGWKADGTRAGFACSNGHVTKDEVLTAALLIPSLWVDWSGRGAVDMQATVVLGHRRSTRKTLIGMVRNTDDAKSLVQRIETAANTPPEVTP